jgi:hypothetical protein
MSEANKRCYVLFKTDEVGPDLAEAADRVRSAPEITLLKESGSALLVEGAARAVRRFTANLDGWRAEADRAVRSAG